MSITAHVIDDEVIETYAIDLIADATEDWAADDMDENGTFRVQILDEPDGWVEDKEGHDAACSLAYDLAQAIRANQQEFLTWARSQCTDAGYAILASTADYRERAREERADAPGLPDGWGLSRSPD
jgi:hypothetical protein